MILTYSFDTRLNLYEDTDWILDIYSACMLTAKKFKYTIRFFGDSKAYNKLSKYIDEYINIEDQRFKIVDDLKIYIHEVSDLNCITIDGDILLSHQLQFPNTNPEVVFEVAETRRNALKIENNFMSGYFSMVEIFDKYIDKSDFLHWNNNLRLCCNVGLIKFNCQDTKDRFILEYKKLRKLFLEEIEPKEHLKSKGCIPSIIISQYNFGLLTKHLGTKVSFLKDFNNYTHFYGKVKFSDKTRLVIQSILTKKPLM